MNYDKGISVIIPVYNSEKYLENCIASLILQVFSDIEYIFVIDKKSTDRSEEIIKKSAERYPNIKIIKPTEGTGAGYNRNAGIEHVTKEYIGFVDADDFISKDYYEKLYSTAKEYDSDIVMGETVVVDENKQITDYYKCPFKPKVNLSEIYSIMEYSTVWNKIYRTEIIKPDKSIRFPQEVIHEDNVFTLKSILKSKNFTSISGAVYYWFRNPNSVTMLAHRSEKCIDDGFVVFDEILNTLYKENLPTEDKLKIIKHNVNNYAVDVLNSPKYKLYFSEKLKILLGKQKAYEILYEAEQILKENQNNPTIN